MNQWSQLSGNFPVVKVVQISKQQAMLIAIYSQQIWSDHTQTANWTAEHPGNMWCQGDITGLINWITTMASWAIIGEFRELQPQIKVKYMNTHD